MNRWRTKLNWLSWQCAFHFYRFSGSVSSISPPPQHSHDALDTDRAPNEKGTFALCARTRRRTHAHEWKRNIVVSGLYIFVCCAKGSSNSLNSTVCLYTQVHFVCALCVAFTAPKTDTPHTHTCILVVYMFAALSLCTHYTRGLDFWRTHAHTFTITYTPQREFCMKFRIVWGPVPTQGNFVVSSARNRPIHTNSLFIFCWLASIEFYLHRIDAWPNEIEYSRMMNFVKHKRTQPEVHAHTYVMSEQLLATKNQYLSAVCIFPSIFVSRAIDSCRTWVTLIDDLMCMEKRVLCGGKHWNQ